jgi:3-hydroxybutyryl-CoA dehydrogenase
MQVRKITVLGAGVMGAGIAQLAAQAGLAVTLQDISAGALQGGLRRAACNLALRVEVG